MAEVTEIDTPGGEGTPAAAFFDLDGTLIIGQTQAMLVRFLRSRKVVSLAFLVGTAVWFIAYKAGLVKVTEASRQKGAEMLRGQEVGEFAAMMDTFVEGSLMPRAHERALAALREHQRRGDRVVVVSAALDPVVKALCDRLGVEEYVGASCEVQGGRYTGRLDKPTPYADRKAEIAKELMARWAVDPAHCWAYADHTTDLALLRSVGHPVAVHPKPGLREAAEAAGWPVYP